MNKCITTNCVMCAMVHFISCDYNPNYQYLQEPNKKKSSATNYQSCHRFTVGISVWIIMITRVLINLMKSLYCFILVHY